VTCIRVFDNIRIRIFDKNMKTKAGSRAKQDVINNGFISIELLGPTK
jgi:hypothetical protein